MSAVAGRLRRTDIGGFRRVAGACLLRRAQETSWREDHRRLSNGVQPLSCFTNELANGSQESSGTDP
jgi:hypothetical protein